MFRCVKQTCSLSSRFISFNSSLTLSFVRYSSGFHTFDDDRNLFGENKYSQFQKKKIAIGELIGFVDKLKELYNNSTEETQKVIQEGSEKKIDTVMEYYCKKGRGDDIKDIIEQMPLTGTRQAFAYLIQGYVNGDELEKAELGLDLLENYRIVVKIPYELLLHGYSKKRDWESVFRILKRMESFGYHTNFESLSKIEGLDE